MHERRVKNGYPELPHVSMSNKSNSKSKAALSPLVVSSEHCMQKSLVNNPWLHWQMTSATKVFGQENLNITVNCPNLIF